MWAGRKQHVYGAHGTTKPELLYSEHYQGLQQTSLYADAIKARGNWIPGVIDPAAQGRTQTDGQQLIQLYRDCGLDLSPALNAVEAGLYQVWQLMSAGKLKVFASHGNWLQEFRLYQRDTDGKVVKAKDHLMDSTRYLIVYGRERMRTKPKPPGDGGRNLVYQIGSQQTRWMQ